MKKIIKESECNEYFGRFYDKKVDLLNVSNLIFNKVVESERGNVMMWLIGKFNLLRYEDLEEIYDDGCLVLWEKMNEEGFNLNEDCIVGYLIRICRNIGSHYLRKIDKNEVSFERMMEKGYEIKINEMNGIEDMYSILEEKENEEKKYEKLEEVWNGLSDIDKMILESYYVDGCKMSEIASRVGYKNSDSVKSRKNKVLKNMMKMMKMMNKEKADFKEISLVA